EISSGITAGVNLSYDEAFDTRVSADLKVRFGGPSTTAAKKKKWQIPTINALTASPKNRDVRVRDGKATDFNGTCPSHIYRGRCFTGMPIGGGKYFARCLATPGPKTVCKNTTTKPVN
ncbi:MAG: hypothetical protein AB8E87_05120, partial [Prochlorococcus sp.]